MTIEPITPSLEERITAAVTDDIPSSDLAALISEIEAAITQADAAAKEERAKALDPVISPDATAAREAMQTAEFARDRLRTVLPRLLKRLREVREDEELASWLPSREAAMARRDKLAAKLREVYLPFVQVIVPLLGEIEHAEQEIRLVNHAAPPKAIKVGGYLLDSVEHAARGPSAEQLRHLQIMKDLRLPDWDGAELPLWPPYRPPDVASFTPALPGDPRLYSDRWEEVWQEQARARAAKLAGEA